MTDALTLAEQRRAEYIDQHTSRSLAVHEAQVKSDAVRLAMLYHRRRVQAERWGGVPTSWLMGLLSGVIAAVLDGTATGISMVAPVVVPALIMMAVSLVMQTIQLNESFNWTVAGRMLVFASWRALLVLFITLTITGAIMWYNNRVNGKLAEDVRDSYEVRP